MRTFHVAQVLEEEDDVSGFLGVKIEKFENVMRLTHLPAVSTLQ